MPNFDQLWEYEDDNIILFWGGVFSNWYKSPFTIDGTTFNCVEQFMMVQKALEFDDLETAAEIMKTKNPKEQKALGRAVANYDDQRWAACRLHRVLPGIQAKFTQNGMLGTVLQGTGKKVIAEASPYDKIWGIGLGCDNPLARDETKWKGSNLLGELIMFVRDELNEK